jgi:hypothetical protein
LPAIVVDPRRLVDMTHGRPWPAQTADTLDGPARVYDVGGRLLGLAELDLKRSLWQPRLALLSAPAAPNDET